MSVIYNSEHSITFINAKDSYSSIIDYKNSWTDFHLIPVVSPALSIYNQSRIIVDIPFSSKTIDYTNDILKDRYYYDGKINGQWEFYVDHNKWDDWSTAKKTIENYLNGDSLYCVLEDNHSLAYHGRFYISEWSDEDDYSKIIISYYIEDSGILNEFEYTI